MLTIPFSTSTLSLQLEHAFVGCPLSFVRESLGFPRQTLDTAKGPRLNRRRESVKIERCAKRFRVSTGGGEGFRVARRARSWPAARGDVGFRGRGRRPPDGSGAGASRRHETARCAVHESPRAWDAKAPGPVVETRKRFAPRSNSQLAEEKVAWPRISRLITDFELGCLVGGATKENSA